MRVYVSARSTDLTGARAAMDRFRAAGHVVTHDWTCAIEDDAVVPMSESELHHVAMSNILGVVRAQVLVALCDRAGPATGTRCELGVAYALGLHVVLVEPRRLDPSWARHFFRAAARVRVRTIDEALEWLHAEEQP